MGWMEEANGRPGGKGPFLVLADLSAKIHRLACPSCNYAFPYVKAKGLAVCPKCAYRGGVTRKDGGAK